VRDRAGWALVGLGALLLLCIAAARLQVPADEYGDLSQVAVWRYIDLALAAGAVYCAGVALVRARAVPGWALAAALAIALAARIVLLVTPPVTSTDLYRYVWDGRVQAAGINPYLYKPADPTLERLRDKATGPEAIFININRPETARTIYPPAAQLLFAAIGLTVPSIWTVKALMLLMDVVAGLAGWGLLRASGRPDAWVLVWAWNPLVILEFAGAGHIDAAAVAASGLALLLAARRRPGMAGAALGLAILCKLLPAALGPAIWRPRGWRAPVSVLAVIVAGYACYASAGWQVLGYLPGYAQEEGFAQGGGYLLLRLARMAGPLPSWAGTAYVVCALLLLAALAAAIVLRPGPPRAELIARDALLLSVALLLTLSPHYPWYLTMAVLPAVVVPRWGALWPSVAGPLLYRDDVLGQPLWPAIVFLPALAWLIVELRRGTEHA
jgi:alpha-1,6-mannosyltransferase